MAHYYFEYGGGLGDVFSRMSIGNGYNVLHAMDPEDTAAVTLISHNPHARELFDYHPKSAQIKVRSFNYWWPSADRPMRARFGLPYPAPRILPISEDPLLTFFPAAKDCETIRALSGQKTVVFSTSGSDQLRSLPIPVVIRLIDICVDLGLTPVFVGRDYVVRNDKPWRHMEVHPGSDRAVNMINQLTVPTVCYLVENAVAVVAAHSAVATLAWVLEKEQLMLYPKSVKRRIDEDRPRLRIEESPKTTHACFGDTANTEKAVGDFTEVLSRLVKGGEQPSKMEVSS